MDEPGETHENLGISHPPSSPEGHEEPEKGVTGPQADQELDGSSVAGDQDTWLNEVFGSPQPLPPASARGGVSIAGGGRKLEDEAMAEKTSCCGSLDSVPGQEGSGDGKPPGEGLAPFSYQETASRGEEKTASEGTHSLAESQRDPSSGSGKGSQRKGVEGDSWVGKGGGVQEQEPGGASSPKFDEVVTEILRLLCVEMEKDIDVEELKLEGNAEILVSRSSETTPRGTMAQVEEADWSPDSWYPRLCLDVTVSMGRDFHSELESILNKYGTVSGVGFGESNYRARVKLLRRPGDISLEGLQSERLWGGTVRTELVDVKSLLFVGNLADDVGDSALRSIFQRHGYVERAFVVRDPKGRSKGYGYVDFALPEDARRAKEGLLFAEPTLRVENAFVKDIKDLFSVSLFVKGFQEDMPNVEDYLRKTIEKYRRVKDIFVHLMFGNSFAVVDFYTSADAGKARTAVGGFWDGRSVLYASFTNPERNAQFYRSVYTRVPQYLGAMSQTGGGQGQVPLPTAPLTSQGSVPPILQPAAQDGQPFGPASGRDPPSPSCSSG